MREIDELQKVLSSKVNDMGGRIYKMGSPINSAMPELIVILPGGHIGFISIKPKDERSPDALKKQIREFRTLGCATCRISDENQVEAALIYILSDAGKDPKWHMFKMLEKELEEV